MKIAVNIHCLSLINYDAVEDVTGRYDFWVSYSGIPRDSLDLGPLHMSPVDRAGPLTGKNFALGSYEKLQPGFRDEKRPKILGTSFCAKLEKQNKHGETQLSYYFAPIMALATLLTVSLQLNQSQALSYEHIENLQRI